MSIVLHSVDNVEFYVDSVTGESGISQSGLARICGVTQPAINQLIKLIENNSVISKDLPKSLEPLRGKRFALQAKGDLQNAYWMKVEPWQYNHDLEGHFHNYIRTVWWPHQASLYFQKNDSIALPVVSRIVKALTGKNPAESKLLLEHQKIHQKQIKNINAAKEADLKELKKSKLVQGSLF